MKFKSILLMSVIYCMMSSGAWGLSSEKSGQIYYPKDGASLIAIHNTVVASGYPAHYKLTYSGSGVSTPYYITSGVTFEDYETFEFEQGARLSVASGINIEIYKPSSIKASDDQLIIDGAGSFSFADPSGIFPLGWVVDPSDTPSDVGADFQKVLTANPGKILVTSSVTFDQDLLFYEDMTLQGLGAEKTILTYSGTSTAFKSAQETIPVNIKWVNFYDLRLSKSGTTDSSIGIKFKAVEHSSVERCMITGFGEGVRLEHESGFRCYYNYIAFNYITSNQTGIMVTGDNPNANTLHHNRISASGTTNQVGIWVDIRGVDGDGPVNNLIMTDNKFNNLGYGGRLGSVRGTVMIGNRFELIRVAAWSLDDPLTNNHLTMHWSGNHYSITGAGYPGGVRLLGTPGSNSVDLDPVGEYLLNELNIDDYLVVGSGATIGDDLTVNGGVAIADNISYEGGRIYYFEEGIAEDETFSKTFDLIGPTFARQFCEVSCSYTSERNTAASKLFMEGVVQGAATDCFFAESSSTYKSQANVGSIDISSVTDTFTVEKTAGSSSGGGKVRIYIHGFATPQ